ncbi:peptidase domain-containing ABC transporter [Hymenobacter cellulosilyticus]|uniref:Peptidase domain-containing ABC transporter n=1 Tax=Hymenobacter cellulosilyticus TaxID=2932248 RepID=A0A8T9Q6I6_9BACT|nr:peptidase domain-containing ABC transporter [Hymenobacter cellulosilyticus]UOQ73174.1 peptidase domain-containing ABC transporter [Hymenobacter cellulosilyticus]
MKKFPFYRQQDEMDCGPTCLRMVAKHYGRDYSRQYLRQHSFLNRSGASLLGLSEAAEGIGLRSLGVKLTVEQLTTETQLPCILHWDQQHFVVLHKVARGQYHIADPGLGPITCTRAELEQHWQGRANVGIALLLEPTPAFHERDEEAGDAALSGWALLRTYLRVHRPLLVQLFIGLLIGSIIQLALPFLTQAIVDTGIRTRNLNFIYLILIAQITLFAGRTGVELLRRWILLHLSTRINVALVSDFLTKLLKLPVAFFEAKRIGDHLQRIRDHDRVESFLSTSSLNVVFSLFNLVLFGAVLGYYDLTILLIFLGGSALYALYITFFLKRRKKLDQLRFHQLAQNQSTLIQLLHGMTEIKLNGCEVRRRWDWEAIQAKLFRLNVRTTALNQYQQVGSAFINELKNIIITFVAAQAVINGDMTLGMMLSVQFIIGQLNAPVNDFIGFVQEMQDANTSLERISEIHSLANEEDAQTAVPARRQQDIYLQHLNFRYDGPGSPLVLDDLSLFIPKGKVTAIVGSSGSGKTTLLKLLLKFYPLTGGHVLVGSTPLDQLSSKEWRRKCGVVMQDGFLFSDTIANNIAVSDEEVDPHKLSHAVQVANIEEFIQSLPLGFHTKIGSDGIGLSQGQKQRLLIARAVYKDPDYLFFDEATSALDSTNEKVIMQNLNEFFEDRTVVVIAHRLSTVKNADQIVMLHRGKIVEVGTHAELTRSQGAYYSLVRNQLELA